MLLFVAVNAAPIPCPVICTAEAGVLGFSSLGDIANSPTEAEYNDAVARGVIPRHGETAPDAVTPMTDFGRRGKLDAPD